METRRLNAKACSAQVGTVASDEVLQDGWARGGPAGSYPWFQPFERWLAGGGPLASEPLAQWIARLDRAARLCAQPPRVRGGAVRFVPQGGAGSLATAAPTHGASARAGAAAYESGIAETGLVPLRTDGEGAIHDYFNALCWLRWPATKARLNALHVAAIDGAEASSGERARGRLRDALTLFDESGAVLVCNDPSLVEAWRAMDWQTLFVRRREDFAACARVFVFGHGLLQKLLRPYKSICAQALALAVPVGAETPIPVR